MEKMLLGKTGMNISRVMFGGIVNTDETKEDVSRYVSYAVENGVNYFDVAPSYGNAEEMLGTALEPYRRDVFLACKSGQRKKDGVLKELHNSLKILRTDYFDVYQLHGITSQNDIDEAFSDDGAVSALIEAKKEGIIRNFGISAHNEDIAIQALAYYDFDTVLFPINWALSLGKGFGDRLINLCHYNNTGLLAMKVLAHRLWFYGEERRYPKSWCKTIYGNDKLGVAAMKYALSKGVAAMVPPGNFEQFSFVVEHIDECLKNPLTQDDIDFLNCELEQVKNHQIF